MNNRIKTIITALAAVVIMAGAYLLYSRLSGGYGISGGWGGTEDKAADFTVYDTKGNEVSLSDYAGKPVVVNFWASWCGPCRSELPHFQSAYDEYGDKIQFLMVNLCGDGNDTHADAQSVLKDGGYSFPVLYDDDSSAAKAYSIRSIPVTCFISADGTVTAETVGTLSAEKLESYIAQIIK